MERILRLRSHEDVRHLLKMYEEDEDLLEDVIIENQAGYWNGWDVFKYSHEYDERLYFQLFPITWT